jgi:hypothetical protein
MGRLAKFLALPTVALALGAAVPTAEAAVGSVLTAKGSVRPALTASTRQAGKQRVEIIQPHRIPLGSQATAAVLNKQRPGSVRLQHRYPLR